MSYVWGVTNPEKEFCAYCDEWIKTIRRAVISPKNRLLLDVSRTNASGSIPLKAKRGYVYLDRLNNIEVDTEDGVIYVNFDYKSRIEEDFFNEVRGMKAVPTRIELLGEDKAIELKADLPKFLPMPEFSQDGLLTLTIAMMIDSDIKAFDTVVPDEMSCPNCGAPIKSKYGCCDYCGGWVEWSF